MKLGIHLQETSQIINYENVLNTYTKGPFYCIMFEKDGDRKVHKYPLLSIFRIEEEY